MRLSSVESIEVINPDTVTRAIRKRDPRIDLTVANRMAAEQCESMVRERIEARTDHFVIETVLASDKYKAIVDDATGLGWNILFVYVALPSLEEAIHRVALRVSQGGHDVPVAKIRKRWPISLGNLSWFWAKTQPCFLFLNPAEFGKPRVLAWKQGGWTSVRHARDCPHAVAPVLVATAADCGVPIPKT
jgi:predicted ABC-type ATPase